MDPNASTKIFLPVSSFMLLSDSSGPEKFARQPRAVTIVLCASLIFGLWNTCVSLSLSSPSSSSEHHGIGDNDAPLPLPDHGKKKNNAQIQTDFEWQKPSPFWSSDVGRLGPPLQQQHSQRPTWTWLWSDFLHQLLIRITGYGSGHSAAAMNSKPVSWYEHAEANQRLHQSFSRGLYQQRNHIMTHAILHVARPRRVFEFAGNGGFLLRQNVLSTYI